MSDLRFKNQSDFGGCLRQQYVQPEDAMNCFDSLPSSVRNAINHSPYKLCCACVKDAHKDYGGNEGLTLAEIAHMEDMIRRRE